MAENDNPADDGLPPMAQALDRACRSAKDEDGAGQSALARMLTARTGRKFSQANIWQWINRTGRAPAEVVRDIEALTGVSRHRLRPDVFGEAPDGEGSEAA